MKTTKILSIAALALMMTACSNDDNDLTTPQPNPQSKGIPFTATISIGQSAATRALTEDAVNNKLVATWTAGEKVALIHNDVVDEMTVSSVVNGTATITGTITGNPANNDAVTIIYPSSAVDPTTKDIRANLLAAQDGTLTGTAGTSISEKYDVRKGTGMLNVGATASLYGNVSLTNQFAIFKLTLGSPIDATHPLYVKDNMDAVLITVTPTATATTVYVAMPAGASTTYKFYAETADNRIVKSGAATIVAGQYYQTTLAVRYPLAMASATADDLGSLLASNGNIYATGAAAAAAGTTAVAMIAYVGSETGSTTYNHGLAIALADANSGNKCAWSNNSGELAGVVSTSSTKTDHKTFLNGIGDTQTLITKYGDDYAAAKAKNYGVAAPTGTSGWFLPSSGQWLKFFEAAGVDVANWDLLSKAPGGASDYTKVYNLIETAATGSSLKNYYWSSSEFSEGNAAVVGFSSSNGVCLLSNTKTSANVYVRSFLAF